MDRTAEMYEKIVKNGPYSEVGPQAQMKIGAAREKQSNYPLAVKAYELAADRYHDRPQVAADAIYRAGSGLPESSRKAPSTTKAPPARPLPCSPTSSRSTRTTRGCRRPRRSSPSLKSEQARGSFETAKFYERYKKWNGALVYYNEVLVQDPNSPYAAAARQRLDELKRRTQQASK